MDFYDEGDDLNDEVDPEEFLELVAGQHALSAVMTAVLAALNDEQPAVYARVVKHIRGLAESYRTQLGEVDEEEIVEYAHRVADSIEGYIQDNGENH